MSEATGTVSVGWGIIGCGDVTEVKSGPGLQKADGSRLIAVMRRTGNLAREYAERHGVETWYDDADELIADPDVTAVYIATRPDTHLKYALRVARAGKPAYVEKPMGRNLSECTTMIKAFREAKLPLFVAYYRRALPRFLKVRELLQEGAIGSVTGVSLVLIKDQRPANGKQPWRLDPAAAGGGFAMDIGSHELDIVDYLLGPITHVSGGAWNLSGTSAVEDRVVGTFVAGSVPGVLSWNFCASDEDDLLSIDGTDGSIRLSVFGNEPVALLRGGKEITFDLANPAHVQQPLIQTVVNELRGKGTAPSSGETAARTNAVLDALLSGYYGGRTDEFWNRPETWPGAPFATEGVSVEH